MTVVVVECSRCGRHAQRGTSTARYGLLCDRCPYVVVHRNERTQKYDAFFAYGDRLVLMCTDPSPRAARAAAEALLAPMEASRP